MSSKKLCLKKKETNSDYCLVKWLSKNSENEEFSVIAISEVCQDQHQTKILIENVYFVKFNGKKYKAMLLKIGSYDECSKLLSSLCDYDEEERPKKRHKKENINANDNIEKIDSIECCGSADELNQLKKKLKIRDQLIIEKDKKLAEYAKKLENKSDEFEKLKISLDKLDKSKLVELGKTILQNFGSELDVTEISVVSKENSDRVVCLSNNYPEIRVPLHVKLDIENDVKLKKSGSKIFRLLIGTLIVDDHIWANNNADSMFKTYPLVINACMDFISKNGIDFNTKTARKSLREICCESRRRLKKVVEFREINKEDSSSDTTTILHKPGPSNSKIVIEKSFSNFSIKTTTTTTVDPSEDSSSTSSSLTTTELVSESD